MSNRTLVELNHDFCPRWDRPVEMLTWATAMAAYMRSGDKSELPAGVTFKHMRHHSEPDPMRGHGDPS
jgi:hypothetical protein